MWVFYDGDRPPGTGTDVNESGFTITVLDKNRKNITDRITNGVQTSSEEGDALQFFVQTFLDEKPTDNPDGVDDDGVDGDEIIVRVTGLRNLQETFVAPPATMQTDPLEGSN